MARIRRLLGTAAVLLTLSTIVVASPSFSNGAPPGPLVNETAGTLNSAAQRGCPRLYTRADFHQAARKAYDGKRKATRHERRTLRRVVRCQRHKSSRRLIVDHRTRYRHHHLASLEHQRILSWGNRGIGYLMLRARGMVDQWPCLDALNHHESGWNHLARNPSSGAGGIPQSLPAEKMAAAGPDWATNPRTQLRWQIDHYLGPRYGGPCAAWAFWQAHHWY